MNIDPGAYIAKLLYHHDSVNIPGLGGIERSYQSASLDQVQDKLHPPSSKLSFNENLTMDDGLLVNYIRQKHDMTVEEAKETVAEYVRQVKQTLDRKEIVIFPKVGRLYRDYESKLKFVPENTNFNLDTFGLPTVERAPVFKTKPRQGTAPVASGTGRATVSAGPSTDSTFGGWGDWMRSNPLPLALLALLIVALAGYFAFFTGSDNSQEASGEAQELPAERYNVKPSRGESAPATGTDTAADTSGTTTADQDEAEGATVAPGQRYAIIAIGLFSRQENVNELFQRIYEEGYEPYKDSVNNLIRVGVQLPYQEEEEINRALQRIRREFDSQAFVLKKGQVANSPQ